MEEFLRLLREWNDACREARDALMRNVAPRLTVEVLLSRLALRAV